MILLHTRRENCSPSNEVLLHCIEGVIIRLNLKCILPHSSHGQCLIWLGLLVITNITPIFYDLRKLITIDVGVLIWLLLNRLLLSQPSVSETGNILIDINPMVENMGLSGLTGLSNGSCREESRAPSSPL